MVIQEFLPNPIGKDTDGEYIKLFNDGDSVVNLNGWRIKDAVGKTFNLNGYVLKSREFLVLDYKTTKISLNNNGETLFLYDPFGVLIDEISYLGQAAEGMVYGKNLTLSEEIKKELFENPDDFVGISNIVSSPTSVALTMLLTGLVLSIMSVYILRRFKTEISEK